MLMKKRIKENNLLKLTDEIIKDKRLFPLLDSDSKLLFQTWVLEIKNLSTSITDYRIIYGWCILTTREDVSDKVTCRSEFLRILKTDDIEYSINKLNIFNTAETIIKILNNLLLGDSFLEASKKEELNIDNINFDFKLPITDIVIRPIIFNETNALISRNPYEKNVLISPYKNVPSFSLIINNLIKERILKDNSGNFYDQFEQVVLKLLNYLQEDTTLPFKTSSSARFGNIEFINTQCSDAFEVHNVWHECIKEEVSIDYGKETCYKKVKVTIQPNKHTCNKSLFVNCFLLNGEQVILDESKNLFHTADTIASVEFESNEPIGKIAISIWKEDNGNFQIWYKNSEVLLRELSISMGIVGMSGTVKSPWLDIIKDSNSKTKKLVEKAEKVSKASYNTMTVGGYKPDPWVKSDRNFSSFIKRLSPEKSNAEFFSKGWDSTDNSHGAISFLEWFKRVTDKAQKVVIQDPFYDTLGLEFLARTTNAGTDFSILTCTQITSLDDTDNDVNEVSEPNRAKRLKSFIKLHPTLFRSLKLSIYDIRSTGSGDSSLIHDRYLLIFEDNYLKTGFHLSNSIQGATKKHPLLITPIPDDVLLKVDNSVNELIELTRTGTDTKIIPLFQYDKKKAKTDSSKDDIIADEVLYQELKDTFTSEKYIKEDVIKSFVCNDSYINNERFSVFWSTFGYFLAHTSYAVEIIPIVEKIIDSDFTTKLRKYLEDSVDAEYPLGFLDKSAMREYDFRFLFTDDFNKILKESLRIERCLGVTYSSGNWGVYFGCNLLLQSDFDEYIKLVKFIQQQFSKKRNIDLADSPLLKLSSKVFSDLYKCFFWYQDNTILEKAVKCKINYIKAIGVASLINRVLLKNNNIRCSDAKDLLFNNFTIDEILDVLIVFLFEIKFKRHCYNSTLESKIFAVISQLLTEHFTENRLIYLFNSLLNSSYPLIEKKITELIFFTLEENKKITAKDIFNFWSNEFFKVIDECKSTTDYSGIVDITGWSLQIVDDEIKNGFINCLQKVYKKYCNEIMTPFKKGSISWNTAFEKILLIRTVLIIAVLYEAENKSKFNEKMRDLIEDINSIETKYQFNMEYNNIHEYSKQMREKYKC
jgi:hypothetical protein